MSPRIVSPIIACALVAAGLAGCGDSDGETTATQPAAQATATATATATVPADATQPTTTSSGQREATVDSEEATLKADKDNGLKMKVTKVYDPAIAYVDEPKKGYKLVGVVVTGQTSGVIEATAVSSITSLETTDGKVVGVRIIADGDCGGGFSADDMLLATKPTTGCIGFEIPKSATPKAIRVAVSSPNGTQTASWSLPKAK